MSQTKLTNHEFCEYLHQNLRVLVNNGRIGLSVFQPDNIQEASNKYLKEIKGYNSYHFVVNVPYAGGVLNWEVLFDPEDFSELPDFYFNDTTFMPEPDIERIAEHVPSWDRWDLTNPESMLNILNEFLALYKKTQMERLLTHNKYANLKTQYIELLDKLQISPDYVDIEIEWQPESDYDINIDNVRVFIKLPIDLTPLPLYLRFGEDENSTGGDYLYVTWLVKRLDSQTKAIVNMSPRVEAILSKVKYPKFTKESTFASYTLGIRTAIERHVETMAAQHEARRLFISTLVDRCSNSIVEYDSKKFQKVHFIHDDLDNYDCLVKVELVNKFPQGPPKVVLLSLNCISGTACTHTINCPYDPALSAEENVDALREMVTEQVKLFQNHSH